MKKLSLLFALLGSFAAQAMIKEEEKVKIVKPLLVYIKNNTATKFIFSDYLAKTGKKVFSITIPAKSNVKINKKLSLAAGGLRTAYKLNLPSYSLDPSGGSYKLTFKNDELYLFGEQGTNALRTISNKLTITTGAPFAIEINEPNREWYKAKLTLVKAKPGILPEEEDEGSSKPTEITTIRTLTYNREPYTLDLKNEETFTLEPFEDLLQDGNKLVAVVSDSFIHFYDKKSYDDYKKSGKKTDPTTGKPIIESFGILVTDDEILKMRK